MRETASTTPRALNGNGEIVRMCRLDLAPEAALEMSETAPRYERRPWDAGWTLGKTADTGPTPSKPPGDSKGSRRPARHGRGFHQEIGADVLAEHRATEQKKGQGFYCPKFKKRRGKRR